MTLLQLYTINHYQMSHTSWVIAGRTAQALNQNIFRLLFRSVSATSPNPTQPGTQESTPHHPPIARTLSLTPNHFLSLLLQPQAMQD